MTAPGAEFDVVIPTVGRPSLAPLVRHLGRTVSSASRIVVADDRRDTRTPLLDGIDGLDDDLELPLGWVRDLADDLQAAPPTVGAVTGRIEVPHSSRRQPSDWERNVACLERAQAVTADMAIRRAALEAVGGFDERFPGAYREDTDLVLRLEDAG